MIKSIHLENFRVLSGERDYEFPEGIVGIVGPNGQGKSTLINAVAWAMYGQEALPLKARDPITWGAKQALVRVEMTLNDGNTWFIERSQKPTGLGKARLWLEGQEDNPKAEGSAPVTAAVTELMGVDREGFMISVFARQFELDRLRSMDPTPRMQTVLRLLGINQITKAVKIVRDEGNDQKKALDALRASQIDTEVVEGDLRSLDAELRLVADEVVALEGVLSKGKEDISSLQAQREALEPKRRAYQAYLNELQSRKTTLVYCQSAFKQAEADADKPEPDKPVEPEYAQVGLWDTQSKVDHLKTEYLRLRDLYISRKAEVAGLAEQLASLKDICPTCGRPFDGADHIEEERDKMRTKITKGQADLDKLSKAGQKAKDDWDTATAALRESNLKNQQNDSLRADYRNAVRQYEIAMAHRAQVKDRLEAAQKALSDAGSALESLHPVEDIRELELSISRSLDVVQIQVNEWTEKLATARGDKRSLELEITRLRGLLDGASASVKQAKALEKQVVQHETAAAELQRLKEKMIGSIIPSLNERASALVEIMTDGKYSELALTPDYEIEYRNPLGEYKNFLNLSGGEQTVFALALRLAISDLRAGNLGVLFLDEAISNLSSEDGRQESVWQAIESLTPRFRQTFVITHVEAYKDRAPFTVRL